MQMIWIDRIKISQVLFSSGGGHRRGLRHFVDRAPTFQVDSIYHMGWLVCTFVNFLTKEIQFILKVF